MWQWSRPACHVADDAPFDSTPSGLDPLMLPLLAPEPPAWVVRCVSALARAWVDASAEWPAAYARDRTFVHLLHVLWVELADGPRAVPRAFERAVDAASTLPTPAACADALWLRYLHWCARPSSGVDGTSRRSLLRRCLERGAPRARTQRAARGDGRAVAQSYDECADAELEGVLQSEPARSLFRQCGMRRSGAARAGPDAWDEEIGALALHACLPSVPPTGDGGGGRPDVWELSAVRRGPPSTLAAFAAAAAQAGAMSRAREALTLAISDEAAEADTWTLYCRHARARSRLCTRHAHCQRHPHSIHQLLPPPPRV